MKQKLFVLFLTLASFCQAQNVWSPDSVIQAPGKSAQEIAKCATQWASTAFAQFSPAISTTDDSVIINVVLPFNINNLSYAPGSGSITGAITVRARDGRFKIGFDQFNHTSSCIQSQDWWSMGLILEDIPEQWVKGWKWKQKREVYKRILEKLNQLADSIFESAGNNIPSCSPIIEKDW